jgi:hypothetical protein
MRNINSLSDPKDASPTPDFSVYPPKLLLESPLCARSKMGKPTK